MLKCSTTKRVASIFQRALDTSMSIRLIYAPTDKREPTETILHSSNNRAAGKSLHPQPHQFRCEDGHAGRTSETTQQGNSPPLLQGWLVRISSYRRSILDRSSIRVSQSRLAPWSCRYLYQPYITNVLEA
jgi:hypothetical protein